MRLHRRPTNTLTRSRDNIHHHYDIGNEFYSLWLGETMAYTCAYFPTPKAALDEAQVAKMDHVCRKLRLRPGQSVVEAGCGWGSLALHMARHYGVRVRAFNISREQIAYARERAKAQGLDRARSSSSRTTTATSPARTTRSRRSACSSTSASRTIPNWVGSSPLASSRPVSASSTRSAATAGSRCIAGSIGAFFPARIRRRCKQMMDIFEECNFSVLDVENMRLHYAKTLECWAALFERSKERVAQMFDERFVRMWRLYLHGSIAAFRTGEMQLFQVVFARGPQQRDSVDAGGYVPRK